jgi:hypothetical protein
MEQPKEPGKYDVVPEGMQGVRRRFSKPLKEVRLAALLEERPERKVKERIEKWRLKFDEFETLKFDEFETVKVNEWGKITHREKRKAGYFREDLGEGVSLDMVYVPGGSYLMGSPPGEGDDSEKPQHRVSVPPFFMMNVSNSVKSCRKKRDYPSGCPARRNGNMPVVRERQHLFTLEKP